VIARLLAWFRTPSLRRLRLTRERRRMLVVYRRIQEGS
jgi:hypothetical protein